MQEMIDKDILSDGKNDKTALVINIFTSVLIVFFVALIIFVNNVSLCNVNQKSMNNTLFDGDNVLISTNFDTVENGDIVVIDNSESGENYYIIKRVVAVAGETIKFVQDDDGIVNLYRKANEYSDFVLVVEDYIKDPMTEDCFTNSSLALNQELTIEPNSFYALGDNRFNSQDSRNFGQFSTTSVLGVMFYRLTPGSVLEQLLLFIY